MNLVFQTQGMTFEVQEMKQKKERTEEKNEEK